MNFRTPPAIFDKLSSGMARIARADDLVKKLGDGDIEFFGSSSDYLRRHIAAELSRWSKVVDEAGRMIRQPEESQTSMKLRFITATLALCTSLCAGTAQAQANNYPSRPVVIINPFPGGATDIGARIYSQKLTESLGKPFVIDYKPGAGSVIGTNFVAKAPPDGYTLLITSAAFTITPATHPDLPYDPIKDLAPISLTLKKPAMLMVHPALPVNDYEEYITYARANPDKLNFGTTGVGGSYHLVGAWLHGATNTRVTYAHYKGSSQLFADQMAGRIHVSPASIFNGLPYVKSGKLRAIVIISKERSPLLPGMKTVAEQGIPDFDYSAWEGMFTTGAVPRNIVTLLSSEFGKIAKMPDVAEKFREDGSLMVGSTSEEFRRHIAVEIERWRRIIKDNNIKAADD